MSLKNRLSTVEVPSALSRKNYTISPRISKPISDRLRHSGRPRTHSRRHSTPRIQTSDEPSLPNLTGFTNNCKDIVTKEAAFGPPQERKYPHQEPAVAAQHREIKLSELSEEHSGAAGVDLEAGG